MFSLKGKKVLVTGASGGIGQKIAELFVAQGACVTLHGRKKDVLEKIAGALNKEQSHIFTHDLRGEAQDAKLIEDTIAHWNGLDILVCNAGLTRDKLLMRLSLAEWQEVVGVNLTSSMILAQSCLSSMMKQRSGRILFMSSIVASMGNAGQTAYSASKAGLYGLTRALAKEVATRGITVNCIAPGFIQTAMTDALPDNIKDYYQKNIPMGSFGTSDDVASCALYLASDEARYMTGQIIHVNGGLWMG